MDEDDIDAMVREVTDSIRRGPYDAALRGVHDMLTIPAQMEIELTAANARIAELTATVERMTGTLRIAVLALAHANTELAPGLYDKAYNAVTEELARAALGEP